jgi:hypothetical protein
MTDLNTIDLRERIAISKDFTPAERDLILAALNRPTEPPDPDERFAVVWSNEHRAWWGPAFHGYTRGLDDAGRYTLNDAIKICGDALMTGAHIGMISEIPVRLGDLRKMFAGRHVPGVILTG